MPFTHTFTTRLDAATGVVFEALSASEPLMRWFAERADVGREVGAPFRFWGRHTLGAPGESLATQRLIGWAPHSTLGFSWDIAGVPTEVWWTLAADGQRTALTVRHEVLGELPGDRTRELVDDHWRLAFANLTAHLAGGGWVDLPDYTDPHPRVRVQRTIAAPPPVVFHALTTPALVNEWFASSGATVEPREGGRYSVNWRYKVDGREVQGGPTRILHFAPPERLVLDWPDWRGDASVTGQSIAFSLEAEGDGTRLTFEHVGFTRTADIGDYAFGWRSFLQELARVAEREAGPR